MPAPSSSALLGSVLMLLAVSAAAPAAAPGPAERLAELVSAASEVRIETRSPEEYAAALTEYRRLRTALAALPADDLGFDDAIDRELLAAHLDGRIFEIGELKLQELVPVTYYALDTTDALFLRPCGVPDRGVRDAVEELRRLPRILDNARKNLKRPARVWTENAIVQASYARLLLDEEVPRACVDDPELGQELVAAAREASSAVDAYERWLTDVLLPRSDRPPTWTPAEIERYQFVHEGLSEYGVDEMLRIAEEEEETLLTEMRALAARIDPSGDLSTVWEEMKAEAPPWDGVLPMAQDYVERASAWLRGPGSGLVDIPEAFDYGARITTPMARRLLSFGGAEYGPTIGGRISGYYVVTPLEPWLTEAERVSRLAAYNPYWTHVISYHEWLGHNVQRAYADAGVSRPMRSLFRSLYLSQAWSFYLEKLLEDEGYYETLPRMERLKTAMARRQMRMWRIQRILTKLRMSRGTMASRRPCRPMSTRSEWSPRMPSSRCSGTRRAPARPDARSSASASSSRCRRSTAVAWASTTRCAASIRRCSSTASCRSRSCGV
ncbi:MAG: DUF885 family protein [Thermoanaerobaculia bacterium]